MLLVTCIPMSRTLLFGWQSHAPGMAGCPVLWDCPDAGLGSPPSLLPGHNGLVAVSTKSGVLSLLHPRGTAGDRGGSAPWAREGVGGRAHGAGGSHRAVGSGALPGEGGTMCKRVLGATRTRPTWRHGQCDAVLPAGCLPAAGRGAHGCAGETPRAGRRSCHGGDRARYPCTPPLPLPPASPGHGHPPLPHIFQASSSPGHRTCSACCGRRSTPSWSCRYWHPSLTGLLAPPSTLAG